MQVFISIRVPRPGDDRETLVNAVAQMVLKSGHQPFVAYQEVQRRGLLQASDFMPYVRHAIEESQLMVVLYDPELRGGLIELGMAYALGIPIWLCHRPEMPVSSSALGCARLELIYSSPTDLADQLSRLLACPEF